jgi:hypothetical protein
MDREELDAMFGKVVAGYEWPGGLMEAVDDLSLALAEIERLRGD